MLVCDQFFTGERVNAFPTGYPFFGTNSLEVFIGANFSCHLSASTSSRSKMPSPWLKQVAGSQPNQAQNPNAGQGRSASSKSKCDCWEARMQGFPSHFNVFCLQGIEGVP